MEKLPFLIFSLFILIASTCGSANPNYVPLEAYGQLPDKSMVSLSPSGDRIAYRVTNDDVDALVVQDLNSGERLGLLSVKEIKPNYSYFISEEKLILVSDQNRRLVGFKGRHEISTAVVYDITTEKFHYLLQPGYGIYTGQTVLGRVVGVSSDGKYAYMPAWQGQYNLLKSNLDTKRKPVIFTRGKSDTIDFFVDNHDRVLARERYDNDKNLHRLQSLIEDEWTTIFEQTAEIRTRGFVGVTPDYKS